MAELPVLAAILSRLFETSKYVVVVELLISHWSNFQSSDEHSLALLCFALVRFFIGSGNSLHRLDQSDMILEPIAKCSLSSSLKFFRFQKAFREKKKTHICYAGLSVAFSRQHVLYSSVGKVSKLKIAGTRYSSTGFIREL